MFNSALIPDLAAITNPNPQLIGGKAEGLLSLQKLNLQTLPAGVVPTTVFNDFLDSLQVRGEIARVTNSIGQAPPTNALELIREKIFTAPIPEKLLHDIFSLRSEWKRPFAATVIVRSSATVEDSVNHSFAGIFESIPCTSDKEVEDAIRTVWASVFSPRAFAYYDIASLDQLPAMALILQPFVEADRAGVMFTQFHRPGHGNQILIEHVAGTGEKLVTGQVNPERIWIPRWPQKGDLADIAAPLHPKMAFDLAQIGRQLEDGLHGPQDVEWCIKDSQLYLLQTRPITVTEAGGTVAAAGNVLLKGVGASVGHGSGAVHLVFNIEDANRLAEGQILTTTMTNPDMVPSMQRSAAIVTDVGGMICHAAIVSRELGVPCVVGTKSATKQLQPGTSVTVDGGSGLIYEGIISDPVSTPYQDTVQWADVWRMWKTAVPATTVPILSTYRAFTDIPASISICILDPYCDLSLDLRAEITPLSALERPICNNIVQDYLASVSAQLRSTNIHNLLFDLARLPPDLQESIIQLLDTTAIGHPLTFLSSQNGWQIKAAPDGKQFALLQMMHDHDAVPANMIVAAPLGLAPFMNSPVPELPEPQAQTMDGMFGMVPEMRMTQMPAIETREAMHQLIPALAQAHQGQIETSTQLYPWLNLRPEVPITTFLKAFVTPGVESIPYVLGFDEPPLHIQFMKCRFHFRQDTLLNFFPKLMQATWDEGFLSTLLQKCRASYETLERKSAELPATPTALEQASNDELKEKFIAWWQAFSHFFSLSFFIQAQGDDCIYPGLEKMVNMNRELAKTAVPAIQLPGMLPLSAPVTPSLTATYLADLRTLNNALNSAGFTTAAAAKLALESNNHPELVAIYRKVWQRWHWMRERDLYYEPYDTMSALLENAFAIRDIDPPDYELNGNRANLALALHFDLARLTNSAEQLLYGLKYGRALAIDRENHHVVWLRASYRLRLLILEWERRLKQVSPLQARDIFFLQPWEILDAIANLPHPPPAELLAKVRNRRTAYEKEIQLKAGKQSAVIPEREEDYY